VELVHDPVLGALLLLDEHLGLQRLVFLDYECGDVRVDDVRQFLDHREEALEHVLETQETLLYLLVLLHLLQVVLVAALLLLEHLARKVSNLP